MQYCHDLSGTQQGLKASINVIYDTICITKTLSVCMCAFFSGFLCGRTWAELRVATSLCFSLYISLSTVAMETYSFLFAESGKKRV